MKKTLTTLALSSLLLSCQGDFAGVEQKIKTGGQEHSLFIEGLNKAQYKGIARALSRVEFFQRSSSLKVQVEKTENHIVLRAPVEKRDWPNASIISLHCAALYQLEKATSEKGILEFYLPGKVEQKKEVAECDNGLFSWMRTPGPRDMNGVKKQLMAQIQMYRKIYQQQITREDFQSEWQKIPSNFGFTTEGLLVIGTNQLTSVTKGIYRSSIEIDAAVQMISKAIQSVNWPGHKNMNQSYVEALTQLENALVNVDANEFDPSLMEGISL